MIFQLLYTINSKTHYVELEADNYQEIKDFFYSCLVGDLIEIREIEYTDNKIIEDDLNYIHSAQVKLSTQDNKISYSFKIPKLRKTIKDNELLNITKQFIKINNLLPELVKTTLNFKL